MSALRYTTLHYGLLVAAYLRARIVRRTKRIQLIVNYTKLRVIIIIIIIIILNFNTGTGKYEY